MICKKNHIVLTIIAFLTGFPVSWCQNDYIKWSPNREISWDNFQGEPDNTSKMDAKVFPGIYFSCTTHESGECEYVLFSFIDSSKSYVKTKSDILLKHERTHFDICEYAVRVYRKIIEQYIDTAEMVDCTTILAFEDEMWNFEEDLQRQYDIETDYSRNEAKQEEWSQKVKNWLEELKEYAEPVSE